MVVRWRGEGAKEWRCGWRLTLVNVTRRPLFRRENERIMLVRCAAECWVAGAEGRYRFCRSRGASTKLVSL